MVKLVNFRRLNGKVPAKEAMMHYFTHRPKQSFREKNRTVTATQLNKDIHLVKTEYPEVYEKFRFTRRHSNILKYANDLKILDN